MLYRKGRSQIIHHWLMTIDVRYDIFVILFGLSAGVLTASNDWRALLATWSQWNMYNIDSYSHFTIRLSVKRMSRFICFWINYIIVLIILYPFSNIDNPSQKKSLICVHLNLIGSIQENYFISLLNRNTRMIWLTRNTTLLDRIQNQLYPFDHIDELS